MRRSIVALASGMVFGAGLALSGMMNPQRVRGFLDIAGNWDPTLAFVMAGAVLVMAIAWRFQARMQRPLACDDFSVPDARKLDARLIGGAALFGIGWGLAGLCPGPAIASLSVNFAAVALFVAALVGGIAAHRVLFGDG